MASRNERHLIALHCFAHIPPKTDASVATALLAIHEAITPSHSLLSDKFSLLKLIKTRLDEPVAKLMEAHGYQLPVFSELILRPSNGAAIALEQVALDSIDGDDWAGSTEFTSSCDALITFIDFCGEHKSDSGQVAKFEPDDGDYFANNDRFGRGLLRKAKKHLPDSKLPFFLNHIAGKLMNAELCLACGQVTQEREERNRLLKTKRDAAIQKMLLTGGQFFSHNRGSGLYCEDHSETMHGSAPAKKGRRQRVLFMSLLFALARKEMIDLMNQLFPPDYEIHFARLAIESKECRKYLKRIAVNVPFIVERDAQMLTQAIAVVADSIRAIFKLLELTPQPYTPSIPSAHIVKLEYTYPQMWEYI
jgi:hypothetical protein